MHWQAAVDMIDTHPGEGVLVGGPVLLVDSNEASRAALRAVLEAGGYMVREASNGVDAVVTLYLARERFTVVVDTYLLDMDGEDFLHLVTHDTQLASRHAYVFLTESSAYPSAVTSHFLAYNGIVALMKPYSREALAAAVADASMRPAPAR